MEALSNLCPETFSGGSGTLFLSLIQTLISAQCALDPVLQYPNIYTEKLNDGDTFDYIVVGAGSAGSIVASRLSENKNVRVLLLEAGGIPIVATEVPNQYKSLQNSTVDWKYYTEPSNTSCLKMEDHRCFWPRGKTLGGSGSINGMLYLRGNHKDYQQWSLNNPGWDYNSVEKYFKKVEKVIPEDCQFKYGTDGKIPLQQIPSKQPIREIIINATKELGNNYSQKETPIGYFDTLNNIDQGLRVSSAKAYISHAMNRKNLFVATNAQVGSVIISTKKNKNIATGVNVKIYNKTLAIYARKEVVLSGGTINSPQILMNSGIGPKKHLESLGIKVVKDLAVGENLQDHLMFTGYMIKLNDKLEYPYNMTDEAYDFLMHRRGVYGSVDILSFAGFLDTLKLSEYPDIQIHHLITPYVNGDGTMSKVLRLMVTLSHPKSRGKILLKSNNPYDRPRIYPNYLDVKEDLDTILRGVRYTHSLNNTKAFRNSNVDFIVNDVKPCSGLIGDKYMECAIRYDASTVFHPVGTCKMGPVTDRNAVVDSKLRVHGVENLRVIDASIMPCITSVNTNGPTMMIGEKGADLLKQTWT